jgi:transcriptional antiterminator NusG
MVIKATLKACRQEQRRTILEAGTTGLFGDQVGVSGTVQVLQDDSRWYIGQRVRVIAGPFKDMIGTIYEINTTNKRVRITVNVFSRQTPVELGFSDIIPEQ